MSLQSFFSTLGSALNIFDPDRPMIFSSNPEEKTVMSELGNVFEGAWSDYTGNTANEANIDYQKEYNEQVFKRADTQYQRTVADLRAAGLSSQLAAGAPSTVAGASQAPSRTVGNESAAIEKLVGIVNSIKQTNANVNLTNAQIDKTNAEASLISQEAMTYTDRMAVEVAYKQSATEYNRAQTQIAMQIGQTKAAEIEANIASTIASTEYTKQLTELGKQQGELYDAQTGKAVAETKETYKKIEKLTQDISKIKEEILTEVTKRMNLSYENEILVEKAVQAAIESKILEYNYNFSVEHGMRTTDQQSKFNIFGLGFNNAESILSTPRTDVSPVDGTVRKYGQ